MLECRVVFATRVILCLSVLLSTHKRIVKMCRSMRTLAAYAREIGRAARARAVSLVALSRFNVPSTASSSGRRTDNSYNGFGDLCPILCVHIVLARVHTGLPNGTYNRWWVCSAPFAPWASQGTRRPQVKRVGTWETCAS